MLFPFSSIASEDANRDLLLLNRFAVSLLRQQNLEDLLWSMAKSVGELLGFEDCVLYLVYGDTLVQRAAYGPKNPRNREIWSPLRIPIGKGITGTVAKTGEAELIHDVRSDPRYISDQIDGVSEICVPIRYHGKVIGVLDAEDEEPAAFTLAQREILMSFANIAAPRIAGAIAEQALADANQQLEIRIADRTSQLQEAIEALREESHRREVLLRRAATNERLKSLGTLAGGLAHDFNNLLHGIRTHVETASEHTASTGSATADLTAALQGCDRMAALIGQLNTFSRGGAPKKSEHDLETLLRRSVSVASTACGVAMPRFVYESDLRRAAVDSTQVDHAVQSLVTNAIEASDGTIDGVSVEIYSLERKGAPHVEILVRDLGPGIDVSIRDRIFDPYFTTKEGGAGLGLAMAYSIAERHGGTLQLDEIDPGPGAVFRLILPAIGEAGGDVEQRPVADGSLPPLHVLLMDDDELVLRATTILLQRLGLTVESYPDGEAAVNGLRDRQAGQPRVDLALLDLSVPDGLGGIETLELLRQEDPELPAVVASGYSDTPALAHPKRFGFDAALSKPFALDDLRDVLLQVVQTRRA